MKPTTKQLLTGAAVTALTCSTLFGAHNSAFAEEVTPQPTPVTTASDTTAAPAQTQGGASTENNGTGTENSATGSAHNDGTAGAQSSSATPTAPAATSEQQRPYTLVSGSANWNFRASFRDYVGVENETRKAGLGILSGTSDLEWQANANQTFTPKTGELSFGGEIHWQKYQGVLNVKISNPVLDLAGKKLLVDAYTAGTLAGGEELTVTKQALLELPDLQHEVRGNTLVIYSHNPRITELSKRLLGFYQGEKGAPFVATFEIQTGDLNAPERQSPVLWQLFPTLYADPKATPPLTDPSEATFDVNVPDPALRACILESLNKPTHTPIVNKVLQELQSVSCVGARLAPEDKIKDLTGLEHARNLNTLNINYQAVSDLTPLAAASKLHTLNVSNNQLRDINPLAANTKLTSLRMVNNKVTDISALRSLGELTTLDVSENRLTSLTGVPERVTRLKAENNRIADISGISRATTPYIERLELRHNRITDISSLAQLRAITNADLRNNFITDPSPLATWAENELSLNSVRLQYNKFTDWSSVAAVPRIDKPRNGEETSVNPKTIEELQAKDAALDSAEAEARNPITTANAATTGWEHEAQLSNSVAAGGITPAEMFTNTPAGATYSLAQVGIEIADADPATEIELADKGTFSIADGVVKFTPQPEFTGTAEVQVVLTTLANNKYVAKYSATVKPLPTPAAQVAAAVREGSKAQLSAGPFVPGESVTVTIGEDTAAVATLTADASGSVSTEWLSSYGKAGTYKATFTGARGKSAAVDIAVEKLPAATVSVSKDEVTEGETLTFTAGPFVAGEQVSLTVHSDPVKVGDFTADAEGMVRTSWKVPANFGGSHKAVFTSVNGITAQQSFKVNAPVAIAAPDTTPRTPENGTAPADTAIAAATPGATAQQTSRKLAKTGADSLPLIAAVGALTAAAGAALARRRK